MAVSERERHEKELREVQEANTERRLAYRPAEVHKEIVAAKASGEDEKVVEVHAFGGVVYVNTHGDARFDRDALFALQKALEAAFQAVS